MRISEPRPAELVLRRVDDLRAAWCALRAQLNSAPMVEARKLVDEIRANLDADWPPPRTSGEP